MTTEAWTTEVCTHCWHLHRGPWWGTLNDGFIVQSCCKCHATRTIHQDHA